MPTVRGTVTLSSGSLANGGYVYISGATTAPIASGSYQAGPLAAGVHQCSAYSDAETHALHDLQVNTLPPIRTHSFQMRPQTSPDGISIQGRVLRSDGSPAEEGFVDIGEASAIIVEGAYSLQVPAGEWPCYAGSEGEVFGPIPLLVEESEPQQFDIQLAPPNVPEEPQAWGGP